MATAGAARMKWGSSLLPSSLSRPRHFLAAPTAARRLHERHRRPPDGGRRAARLSGGTSGGTCRLRASAAAAGLPGAGDAAGEGATVLLDLLLPGVQPKVACRAIFGTADGGGEAGSSSTRNPQAAGLLVRFLIAELGCADLDSSPWQADAAASSSSAGHSRLLTYSAPLSPRQRRLLPLGPAAVPSRDEQRLEGVAGGGVAVSCRCTSSGVPFADCFANLLDWQLQPAAAAEGPGQERPAAALRPLCSSSSSSNGSDSAAGTRVRLTARCHFHRPVLGPLRGHIERESLQSMAALYATFGRLLQAHYSPAAAGSSHESGGTAVSNLARSSSLSSGLGGEAGGGGGTATAVGSRLAGGAADAGSTSGAGASSSGDPGSSTGSGEEDEACAAWKATRLWVKSQLTAETAEGMLEQVQALWPEWSAAGCRLPLPAPVEQQQQQQWRAAGGGRQAGRRQQSSGSAGASTAGQGPAVLGPRPAAGPAAAGDTSEGSTAAASSSGPRPGAPSPDEAAAALRAISIRAASGRGKGGRGGGRQLARNRVVQGLVRALQLRPPVPEPALAAPAAASRGNGSSAGNGSSTDAAAQPGLRCAPAAARALCALSALGGSLYWVREAEVLCALLPLNRLNMSQITDTVAALGRLRHHTEHLPLLEEQAAALISSKLAAAASGIEQHLLGLPRLSGLVKSFASLGYTPAALLDLVPAVCTAGEGRLAPAASRAFESACMLGWSLAAAGCLDHPAMLTAAAELATACERLHGDERAVSLGRTAPLLQLHQLVGALRAEAAAAAAGGAAGSASGPSRAAAALALLQSNPDVAREIAAAAEAWQRASQQVQVSSCQADVASTARSLGMDVREEHAVCAGATPVDIAVPSRRLAIEVDGPTHFLRNSPAGSPPLPVGSTLLKRRVLETHGWVVVSISPAEWEGLRGADQKRRALQEAIAAAEAAREWAAAGGGALDEDDDDF